MCILLLLVLLLLLSPKIRQNPTTTCTTENSNNNNNNNNVTCIAQIRQSRKCAATCQCQTGMFSVILLLTETRSTTNPEPDSKFIQSSLRKRQNIMRSQYELLRVIIVCHWTKFFLKSCGLLVVTVHET